MVGRRILLESPSTAGDGPAVATRSGGSRVGVVDVLEAVVVAGEIFGGAGAVCSAEP